MILQQAGEIFPGYVRPAFGRVAVTARLRGIYPDEADVPIVSEDDGIAVDDVFDTYLLAVAGGGVAGV